jgi:hypothetical protein
MTEQLWKYDNETFMNGRLEMRIFSYYATQRSFKSTEGHKARQIIQ